LVHPPYWENGLYSSAPPLGLGYIGAVLENNGFDVSIIDPNPLELPLKEVIRQVADEEPELIGIDCGTAYRYEAFELAAQLKTKMPNVTLVMGGPHVSFTAEETLARIPEIDVIVRGEGEVTMLELAKRIAEGKDYKIKGITFRENGKILYTPNRPFSPDLDAIPFPAFHHFPLEKYEPEGSRREIKKLRHCSMITSRGCPIGCVFCASSVFWGKRFRARSPENVLGEINYLVSEYGIEHIHFFDDTFAMNPLRAKKICQGIIDQDIEIKFRIMGRADTMDEELTELLKNAGCYQIDFGVETGSPRVMKNIHKRLDLRMVEKAFKRCREAGIDVLAFLMVGLPGEREVDIQETIEFIRRAEIDWITAAVTTILPGSELYHRAKSMGMIDEDVWFTYRSPAVGGLTKDAPPYLEYFSADELNHFIQLFHYEGWKKKGKMFYLRKVLNKLFEPSSVFGFLKHRISS
jgi:radical SAM superfamily enzyme YgiQ (UPF0313 family)